jgi:Flp pilus assembly protein TadD
MHYFNACHYREKGDVDKERTHLKAAVEADPTHADVLIAMYRFAGADDAWRASIKERIEKVVSDLHAELDDARRALEANPGEQNFSGSNTDLARLCNEYAWLVGNTFGDFDEAVKLSRKSLELRPNYAGFLDTLGRCYYAKGDLVNAMKYQAQAVKLNSYSGQIRRQLEFFVKEAKDRGVNLPPADDTPPAAPVQPQVERPAPPPATIPRPTGNVPPRPVPQGKSPGGTTPP